MITIRKASPADALGITIVNVYTWDTAYRGLVPQQVIDERIRHLQTRAAVTKETIAAQDNFLVATEDDTIIGFCMFGSARAEAYAGMGEVYALYVLEGFQGKHIGKALFLAGIKALQAMGYSSLIINCLRGNPALAFYRHMGGEPIGQRTDEISGHRMTEDVVLFAAIEETIAHIAEDGAPHD